jgi:epoxide hydrolase-like predicted phosphatase
MIQAVIFDCFGVLCNERGARYEQVVDFVRQTHKEYKTAMLSNVSRQFVDFLFSQQEQAELFDAVVISSEVGLAKPDELIYEMTAMKLGVVPEECVMIDDSEANAAGARQAGMQAILYKTLEQCQAELTKLLEKNHA